MKILSDSDIVIGNETYHFTYLTASYTGSQFPASSPANREILRAIDVSLQTDLLDSSSAAPMRNCH